MEVRGVVASQRSSPGAGQSQALGVVENPSTETRFPFALMVSVHVLPVCLTPVSWNQEQDLPCPPFPTADMCHITETRKRWQQTKGQCNTEALIEFSVLLPLDNTEGSALCLNTPLQLLAGM